MTQLFRLLTGGQIDRGQVLRFTFDGQEYEGHPGDTLASALLANGVRLVARSFKYHRPRGIFSAGAEEPSALVQLETGADTEPNRRATDIALYDGLRAASQHAWPKLDADLYLPALIEGALGSKRWMAARLGSRGGQVRSEAKAGASRENGKLGGRPRKHVVETA